MIKISKRGTTVVIHDFCTPVYYYDTSCFELLPDNRVRFKDNSGRTVVARGDIIATD